MYVRTVFVCVRMTTREKWMTLRVSRFSGMLKPAITSVDRLSSCNVRKSYVNTCGGKAVACEIVFRKPTVALSCVRHTENGFSTEEKTSRMSPWLTEHVPIFIPHSYSILFRTLVAERRCFFFPREVFSSEEASVSGFFMLIKHPCPSHLHQPGATRGIAAPL